MDYISRALVADALAQWRSHLRATSTVSPLRDLVGTQAATIELRGSHPAGLAPLFAGRPTLLSTLLREPAAFHAAAVRGRVILEQAEADLVATGVWTAALVIGTASWQGRELPVLLRPLGLERVRDDDLLLTLHPTVSLNPVLATEMRERGVDGDPLELASQTLAGKEFDPRPVWNLLRSQAAAFAQDGQGGLEVKERLLVGAFDDPEQRLLDDLDALDPVIGASDVVAAIAGDQDARVILAQELPAFTAADRDPFGERGVGDLDDSAFAALDVVAQGRSVTINAPAGADGVGFAVAVAADAAATGRTSLIVSGSESTLRAVQERIEAEGIGDLALTCLGDAWHAQARAQLLASLTLDAPAVDEDLLREIGDALLVARRDVAARHEALHRPRRPWGASAYEVVQAIVRLTSSDPAPATSARLSSPAVAAAAEHGIAHVAAAVVARVHGTEVEVPSLVPPAEPEPPRSWWSSVAVSDEHGRALDVALADVIRALPGLRSDAQVAHTATGLDEAQSLGGWREQVQLFHQVQRTLDHFSPSIYHHALRDMVAATAPKGDDAASQLPRRSRKALAKRAEEFLRPGRGTADLHERLLAADDQAAAWRTLASAGGWPTVPDAYEAFQARLERIGPAWELLAAVLPDASGLDEPAEAAWADLASALTALAADVPGGIEAAPAAAANVDLDASGLGELVAELEKRQASPAQIKADVEFAWWASAFDAIVAADPRLIEAGALAHSVERYLGLDEAFAERRVGPLMRAAADLRRRAIARYPEDARDLFATLMEGAEVSVRDLRRNFGGVTRALRPVVVTGAEQVPHVLPPSRCVDVLVIIGVESLAAAQLIPALGRAGQVVLIADQASASSSAVTDIAPLLPVVTLRALPQARDPRVSIALQELGYGQALPVVPGPGEAPGAFHVVNVDAAAPPVLGRTVAESSRAEVASVVERVMRGAVTVPRRSLAVVTGSELHAARIVEALLDRDAHVAAATPVVVMGDAAGLSAHEVIVSLGYCRDQRTGLPNDLGIVTSPEGPAALAQALLVGREATTIVTALDATALGRIDASLAAEGYAAPAVLALRRLLEAEPRQALAPERVAPGPSDWLLADVARLLRAQGLAVRMRYGVGAEAIALVVGDAHDTAYRVAVVTDDQSSGARMSVRDRLRWQYRRLESLGWDVVSLWTLDVFLDPVAAADRVASALRGEGPVAAAAPEAPEVVPDAEVTIAPSAPEERAEAVESVPDLPLEAGDGAEAVPDLPLEQGDGAEAVPDLPLEAGDGVEAVPDLPLEEAAARAAEAWQPRRVPIKGAGRPLIPTRAWEDEDAAWGDRGGRSRDDEIRGDRPPHW